MTAEDDAEQRVASAKNDDDDDNNANAAASNDDDTNQLAKTLQESLQIKGDDDNDNDDNEQQQQQQQMIMLQAWREAAPAPLVQVADWIRNGTIQRILALTGAGLSVAAGIPDLYVFQKRLLRLLASLACLILVDSCKQKQQQQPQLTNLFC